MCARSQVSLIFGLDDLGTTHVNLLRMYAENTKPFTMIHVLMSLLHTVIWYGINDLMNDCLNKISKSNIIYIGTSLGSFFSLSPLISNSSHSCSTQIEAI